MKIFTGTQIQELDKYTIEHEPIKSIDLMERAARALTKAITAECSPEDKIVVFAGPGNNGGDALAVSRMLADRGYDISVFLFNTKGKLSEDCAENRKRALENKNIKNFIEVTKEFDPPALTEETVVIDGLFGTGLAKPLESGYASLVKYVNQAPCRVISIDMPSGLLAECNTYNIQAHIIRADLTLTLHTKKLALLFADNQQYIGRLKVLDIGLSEEYIRKTSASYTMQEIQELRPLLLHRPEFSHKGNMGHALLIAGSYGMAGAAMLAAKACLRSGVGKLTVHTPKKNCEVMQIAVPEAVLQVDHEDTYFSEAVAADEFDALGIGPGLGQEEGTAIALIAQLRRTNAPIVVDADALNILASHRTWMQQLPKNIIMTPHPKEFDRLSGSRSSDDYERLMKAVDMSVRLQVYIILKGHYSALCLPDGKVVFNTTGNAGMATAGSGDVLTGIITGLLARGYHQREACLLGMYLHGLAGDLAVHEKGKESLIASDLIDYLPEAFRALYYER
ncbi:MAG: NAD(P)H-hydrate dehydratase [Prevotella sp.]|nr:NAD(P)H-hydrate dehydratase [Prevotella sp.]